MAINYHPKRGLIIRCDYDQGFRIPEMVKKRPVVVISPPIENRRLGLCTVVALSTTAPDHIMPYHAQLTLNSPLPKPYNKTTTMWIKGDMVNTVGFHRLDLLRCDRDKIGLRQYYMKPLTNEQLKLVYRCVLNGLGLANLTKYQK